MKSVIVSLAFLGLGLSAQAADLDTCLDRVTQNCLVVDGVDLQDLVQMDKNSACKIIAGGASDSGSRYNQRVAFFDRNSVISVELRPSLFGICTAVTAELNGRLVDSAVLNGRLFFAHTSNRVIVIGRNNTILEMLNSHGESYESVVGVKITRSRGENKLTLERENDNKTTLSDEQLETRLNTARTVRVLSK